MNPYIILGIRSNATPERIEKAYSKKAKETHPDRGGTQEAFQMIKLAYDVLIDPEKRKQYDETGVIPDDKPDLRQASIYHILSHLFQSVMIELMQKGLSVKTENVVKRMKTALVLITKQVQDQRTGLEKLLTESQNTIGKFSVKKDKENIMGNVARYYASQLEKQLKEIEEQIKLHEEVYQLLDGVNFDFISIEKWTLGMGVLTAAKCYNWVSV